jgi:arylsulfatase A-like enzyme
MKYSNNKKGRSIKTLGIGFGIFLLSPGLLSSAEPEEKPNIVLVMVDNLGYGDFGFSGNKEVKTPNIDNFAREGIQFTRFYANPMCSPTRASLMTGRYYYRTGVIHTSRGGAKMHGDEVTIAEYLNKAGYATGLFGKWHLGDNYPMRQQDQGFQEVLSYKNSRIGQVPDQPNTYFNSKLYHNGKRIQTEGYCTDVFTDTAIRFIEQNRNRPFFAYLPYNAAHIDDEEVVGLLVDRKYSDPY